MARTYQFARAMFFAAVALSTACSDEPANDGDAGAPRSDGPNDVIAPDLPADDAPSDAAATDSTLDLAVPDAAGDAPFDEASTDGDAACTCTLFDAGLPAPLPPNGLMSLPCYCAMPWPGLPGAPECASYAVATRCDSARMNVSIETYTNCNFVTVRYGNNFGVVDTRVYDHTTHELVGASRGTDHTLPCGASQAVMIVAGILPGPECQTSKIEWQCVDGGGVDASGDDGDGGDATPRDDGDGGDAAPRGDGDGACVCEPDERHEVGDTSLSCYCDGRCLTYDQALTSCGSDSPPAVNRVEDYEACNLVVITSGTSIPGGGALVYDRTTHDLVGGSFSADYPAFKCSDASVFGVRAGTFPPPGCTRSRSVPRCPRDVDGG